MAAPWELLAHIQNFLQLNFLFSGLEVSSTAVFAARAATFITLGTALVFGTFRVIMKALDCLQTFLAGVGPLPRSFFLVLLLVIPLSQDSLGARWIGYILLALCTMGLALTGALALVLWKYGVDQALRLIDRLRSVGSASESRDRESHMPPDNEIRPLMDPPVMRAS